MNNQLGEVERLARQAFADSAADEGDLAWVAAAAEEKGVSAAPEFLENFVSRFPALLHLPRIYLADNLARAGRFDEATEHARRYLRRRKTREPFEKLGSTRILRHGVSHAFLLLTAAYTELGARSYSEGVLRHALHFDLVPDFIQKIQQELARLAVEMRDPANKATNERWNAFFARAAVRMAFMKHVRVEDFLSSRSGSTCWMRFFRFNSQFKVGEAELYLLVDVTSENANILM